MAINANLGTQTFIEKNIIDPLHPSIISSMEALDNNGVLVQGLIVAKDGNGLIVAYDPNGAPPLDAPVGILTKAIDTAEDNVANVLRHGTVIQDEIILGDGLTDPSASDLEALRVIMIFPV